MFWSLLNNYWNTSRSVLPFYVLSHFTLSVYFLLSFCSWLPSPSWRLWVELLRKTILMSWRRLLEKVSWSFSISTFSWRGENAEAMLAWNMCIYKLILKIGNDFLFVIFLAVLDDHQNPRLIKALLHDLSSTLCILMREVGKSVLVGNINIWVCRLETILNWQQQLNNLQIPKVGFFTVFMELEWPNGNQA